MRGKPFAIEFLSSVTQSRHDRHRAAQDTPQQEGLLSTSHSSLSYLEHSGSIIKGTLRLDLFHQLKGDIGHDVKEKKQQPIEHEFPQKDPFYILFCDVKQ